MKKIKWIVFLLLTIFVVFILFAMSGNQITIARCIVTENDFLYMACDDKPVFLNYNKDTNYQTGDLLLILHSSAFAESWPEQTRAYFVMKISSGTKEDVPQKALDILIELTAQFLAE